MGTGSSGAVGIAYCYAVLAEHVAAVGVFGALVPVVGVVAASYLLVNYGVYSDTGFRLPIGVDASGNRCRSRGRSRARGRARGGSLGGGLLILLKINNKQFF